MGDEQLALNYLNVAIQKDSNYQPANLWLGVVNMFLGKAEQATMYLEKAIAIDPTTIEAQKAQTWLDRIKKPLITTILNFESDNNYLRGNIGDYAVKILYAKLLTSGLYQLIPSREIKEIRYKKADPLELCTQLRRAGVQIMITGLTHSFVLEEDFMALGPLIIKDTKKYYKASGTITVRIYGVKDCTMLKTITKSCEVRWLKSKQDAINAVINCNCEAIAQEIHKVIL